MEVKSVMKKFKTVSFASGCSRKVIEDGTVMLDGWMGDIVFEVNSDSFYVSATEISLFQPAVEIDGEVYVPILFFRDVFGVGTAFFEGGTAIINDGFGDME